MPEQAEINAAMHCLKQIHYTIDPYIVVEQENLIRVIFVTGLSALLSFAAGYNSLALFYFTRLSLISCVLSTCVGAGANTLKFFTSDSSLSENSINKLNEFEATIKETSNKIPISFSLLLDVYQKLSNTKSVSVSELRAAILQAYAVLNALQFEDPLDIYKDVIPTFMN